MTASCQLVSFVVFSPLQVLTTLIQPSPPQLTSFFLYFSELGCERWEQEWLSWGGGRRDACSFSRGDICVCVCVGKRTLEKNEQGVGGGVSVEVGWPSRKTERA